MPNESILNLKIQQTQGAAVKQVFGDDGWHLEIPSGPEEKYRLAQLDDYSIHRRDTFPWKPPLTLNLRARVSTASVPGTWGFGLWNDPFSLSLGLGGGTRRFPALPNAAWFFFASPENYLSFRTEKPAQGFLAQTFCAPKIPAPILALGALGLPLLLWPWLARKLRPVFARVIEEDSFSLLNHREDVAGKVSAYDLEGLDVTRWHEYSLEWGIDHVFFRVDDQTFETGISPEPPLGLVIWIDNQYAAFPPNGKLAYGTLTNLELAWMEIQSLKFTISF